jgi:hypothetical protein
MPAARSQNPLALSTIKGLWTESQGQEQIWNFIEDDWEEEVKLLSKGPEEKIITLLAYQIHFKKLFPIFIEFNFMFISVMNLL